MEASTRCPPTDVEVFYSDTEWLHASLLLALRERLVEAKRRGILDDALKPSNTIVFPLDNSPVDRFEQLQLLGVQEITEAVTHLQHQTRLKSNLQPVERIRLCMIKTNYFHASEHIARWILAP